MSRERFTHEDVSICDFELGDIAFLNNNTVR